MPVKCFLYRNIIPRLRQTKSRGLCMWFPFTERWMIELLVWLAHACSWVLFGKCTIVIVCIQDTESDTSSYDQLHRLGYRCLSFWCLSEMLIWWWECIHICVKREANNRQYREKSNLPQTSDAIDTCPEVRYQCLRCHRMWAKKRYQENG
jgi:hypothetical protein